jgi:PAS domain S-box-containing protein
MEVFLMAPHEQQPKPLGPPLDAPSLRVTRLADDPLEPAAPVPGPEQPGWPAMLDALVGGPQAVLDALPDIVYLIDPAGIMVYWNKRLEEVTGFTHEEIRARNAMDFFPPEERAWHKESLRRKLELGYDELESLLVTKDGRTIPYHWSGLALRDTSGRAFAALGTGRDVSERNALLDQLATQNRRLRELGEQRDLFMHVVSHELRTPLTSVMGYLEFMEEGVGGALSAEQAGFVREIAASTNRMIRLVDDLLDAARAEAGGFRLERRPIDLGELARETARQLEPQARARDVALVVEAPASPLRVSADPERVRQVLLNLLGNGMKFTPAGGQVRVRAAAEPGWARVCVTDTGPGIAPEHLGRLFEPYFQVAERGQAARGGLGLGLFIAKGLIAAHGGAIGAENAPGAGARFWFTLPLAAPSDGGEPLAGTAPADRAD